MNDLKFWRCFSLLLLIFIIITYSNKKEETMYIAVPSKSNNFKYFDPIPVKGIGYTYILDKDTVMLEHPINKELEFKYLKALSENNELALKIMYLEAIQMRQYKKTFKDNHLTLDLDIFTTGTLDSLNLKYTTNEDQIPFKIPTTKFRIKAGPSLDISNEFKITPGVMLGIEGGNKNTLLLGGNVNKEIKVGYLFNILDYKK